MGRGELHVCLLIQNLQVIQEKRYGIRSRSPLPFVTRLNCSFLFPILPQDKKPSEIQKKNLFCHTNLKLGRISRLTILSSIREMLLLGDPSWILQAERPNRAFQKFRTSRFGNRRVLRSSGTSCDRLWSSKVVKGFGRGIKKKHGFKGGVRVSWKVCFIQTDR